LGYLDNTHGEEFPPNYNGSLATAGGVIFTALLDGTVAAFDDSTL
jgi:hypothetical protein